MLVDINLLPHKTRRSPAILFLTVILFLLTIIAFIIGFFLYQGHKQELETIKSETEFTIKLREIEEEKQLSDSEVTDFDRLELKKEWILGQQISVVFLLNHFVSLLPERGFFQNYTYSDQGNVNISVQFDTAREAANYLHQLNQSSYILEATLQNLTTSPTEVAEENVDSQSDILPRYTATYQVTVNRAMVKLAETVEEESE